MNRLLPPRLAPLYALANRVSARWRGSLAQRLYKAWLTELIAMLPAKLSARLLPDVRRNFLPWPLADAIASEGPYVLLLPCDQVLVQQVTLPLAATQDLNKVLGFEIDKYTPFPREQLRYVARLESKSARTAQVLLVAILRERLTAITDHCKELGLNLEAIDVGDEAGQPLGIDLLPDGIRPTRSRGVHGNRYLALLCAVLAVTTMLFWLHAREGMLDAMRSNLTEQHEQVEQLQQLRRELTNTQGAANYLAQHKAARPTLSAVLVDLNQCLGDDSWVEQLEVNDSGVVSFSGQSTHASALIGRIKACQTLDGAQFQGVIQPDPQTAKDRYSLQAHLREEASHAPQPKQP